MNDPAGLLRIALGWDGARWRVDIDSSRPLAASRVFIGKPVAEVARQIPLLYSLCATAQSQAFAAAVEAIANLAPEPAIRQYRQQLLRAELVKEHLWRLLLDWPPLLGLVREDARMARIMATWQGLRANLRANRPSGGELFIPGARLTWPNATATENADKALKTLSALGEQMTLGIPAADWLASCDSLEQWRRWAEHTQTPVTAIARALHAQGLEALGQSKTALLTQPDLTAIAHQLNSTEADAFIAAPSLNGRCQETTPLARMAQAPLIISLTRIQGRGLLVRFAALLIELAQHLSKLGADHQSPPSALTLLADPHTGLAAVEAARGLLVHRIIVRDGLIERHQVLAPTEWNFHPQGILRQALGELPPENKTTDRSETERLTRLLITAIDPCVDYKIIC